MMDQASIIQGLVGKHVRLWPYAKECFAPDILVQVCQQLNDSGMASRVFWEAAIEQGENRVDLTWFMQYMNDVAPLFVQDLESGDLVGLVWFNNFSAKHRANINVWYRRKAWGKPAREGTAIATRYAFALWGLQQIWGFTPWPEAVKHVIPLGYKQIATLPGYAYSLGSPRDLYIVLKEK